MSAALFSLDGPARGVSWPAEPAAFYEAGRAGKPGRGSEAGGAAEPGAAGPAMYDDESAIDFSAYIDSMAAVPTLELCHDELFADLFNSNHKAGAGAAGALLSPSRPWPNQDDAMIREETKSLLSNLLIALCSLKSLPTKRMIRSRPS
uniref:CEBPD protein n=1 Tax=Canis lupus dingo TaxID=286419 RepID=A0A8C0JIZ9_CANLU